MTYIFPVLYVIVSYTFFLLAGCFDNAIKLQILSILSAFYHGNRQFDCCADRRKKVVKKDIAELHFDYQVWTDPVLPD